MRRMWSVTTGTEVLSRKELNNWKWGMSIRWNTIAEASKQASTAETEAWVVHILQLKLIC